MDVDLLVAITIGFLAGIASGMLGIGGGILFVPALVFYLDQSLLEAESTSLLAMVPVAILGVWRQHGYGNVRIREGAVIGMLALGGVVAGTSLANALAERALELGFAGLQLFFAAALARRAMQRRPPATGS